MAADPVTQAARISTEPPLAGVVAFLKILRKHWAVVVACVALACGAALLYTKSVRRVYQASSLIEMNPRRRSPWATDVRQRFDMSLLFFDPQEYYQTQYNIITSRPVLKAAAEAISLEADYEFFGRRARRSRRLRGASGRGVLGGHVTVEPVKGSRLAHIKVSDFDPKRAKRLCDAVANAYIEQNLETAVSSSADAVAWLGGQIDHIKSDLDRDENTLYDFKQKNDLPSISINDSSNMLRLEMQEYDEALTHTRTRKAELLARQSRAGPSVSRRPRCACRRRSSWRTPTFRAFAPSTGRRFSSGQTLIAEGKGENHPLVKEADARVADSKTALLTEVTNLEAAVVRDLAVIERQEQAEAALFDASRRSAVDLNMKEIEYHRLDRSREREREALRAAPRADEGGRPRAHDAREQPPHRRDGDAYRGAPISPARVAERRARAPRRAPPRDRSSRCCASSSTARSRPRTTSRRSSGSRSSASCPSSTSAEKPRGRGRRGRRPRAGDETAVDGPPELIVHNRPLERGGRGGAQHPHEPDVHEPGQAVQEAPRHERGARRRERRPWRAASRSRCAGRAAGLHRRRRSAPPAPPPDLRPRGRRRPHERARRRSDARRGRQADRRAESLVASPPGRCLPTPRICLQSERFRKFIEELGERFDRVVIDSPPLVAVTDSAIISTLVDGTVFVVRAFQTGKHLSAQGLRALRDVEAPDRRRRAQRGQPEPPRVQLLSLLLLQAGRLRVDERLRTSRRERRASELKCAQSWRCGLERGVALAAAALRQFGLLPGACAPVARSPARPPCGGRWMRRVARRPAGTRRRAIVVRALVEDQGSAAVAPSFFPVGHPRKIARALLVRSTSSRSHLVEGFRFGTLVLHFVRQERQGLETLHVLAALARCLAQLRQGSRRIALCHARSGLEMCGSHMAGASRSALCAARSAASMHSRLAAPSHQGAPWTGSRSWTALDAARSDGPGLKAIAPRALRRVSCSLRGVA